MTETTTHTKEEVLEIIQRTKQDRIIQAQRIDNLFHKYKKFLRTTYETTEFKQPVMLFERRSGEIEFYENITTGLFEYKHSDGTQRYLIINPAKQKRFGFANQTFKGYICHEDHPTPLPDDPFETTEQVNIVVDKALNDIKEWKTKELNAQAGIIWKIAAGIAIIGLVYVLYTVVAPQKAVEIAPAVVQTIKSNATQITQIL